MNHFFLKLAIPQSMIQALLPWLLADVTGGGRMWDLLDKFSSAVDTSSRPIFALKNI